VHVKMLLKAPPESREVIDRVFGMYSDRCPLYRTLKPAIAITSSYELV